MSFAQLNTETVKRLIIKDWQIYQKQMSAYLIGLIFALSLLGTAKPWAFYAGAFLLLILLIAAGCFAIGSSLMDERKEHTQPFIMSLPVSPLDFYVSKILGNVLIFLVPLSMVVFGTIFLVLYTPLPNGLLVYAMLLYGFIFTAYCIVLCVAIAVESEGWNIFAMIGTMNLVNPFIFFLGSVAGITEHTKTENIVWNAPALSILSVQFLIVVIALGVTYRVYSRKTSFL